MGQTMKDTALIKNISSNYIRAQQGKPKLYVFSWSIVEFASWDVDEHYKE